MPRFDAASPFEREAKRLQGVRSGTLDIRATAVATVRRQLPIEARKDILDEYNLPADRVDKDLRTTSDDTSVTLIGGTRPIGLEAFIGSAWTGPNSAGAVARVFNDKPPHVYAGTFMAYGRSGNRQIFQRVHRKGGGGKKNDSLPIRALYGAVVASMLRKGERETRLGDFVQLTLAQEIGRLLERTQPI
jgi:hypothetical protein